MTKKITINHTLERLEKIQTELVRKRIDAIRKSDLDTDEFLRNHVLVLEGYRKDIEVITEQINEYISSNKLLVIRRKKRKGKTDKSTKSSNTKTGGRAKPLPPVGTKLHVKYKNKDFWGDITKKGVKIEGIDEVFPSMSAAVVAVTGKKTISGWSFWKIINT